MALSVTWEGSGSKMGMVKQSSCVSLFITWRRVSTKYSWWYMWSLAGSSTQIQKGSELLPWKRSFHRKSGVTVSLTRSTDLVMGWMVAASSTIGTSSAARFSTEPTLTCLTRRPISLASSSRSLCSVKL